MAGFWSIVQHVIREADLVVFVLDARMPELSRNARLEELIRGENRQLFSVFTKSDLLSPEVAASLKQQYPEAFFVSGTRNIGLKKLKTQLLIEGKRLGREKPKVGVVGYPNVGKSALINALAHRARARVSPKAGTTRGVQFVRAGSLKILDTPGVIPYEDKEDRLGMIAAKNPEKLKDPEKVALEIIALFLKQGSMALSKQYSIETTHSEPYDILLRIGKHRGFLKRGGEVDEMKTALTIVRDWQRGKLLPYR